MDLYLCLISHLLWMGLYGLVSLFLNEFAMDGFVWICICVSHCICYEWVGTDLRGGWLLVAVPRWFPSCHTEAAPTQTHTDPKLTKAQICFRSVLSSIQCVIYWVSSCQPQSYVHAWSLGERQHCVEWFMLTWCDGGSIEKDAVRQLYIISCSSLPSTWPSSLYVGAQASIAIGITRNGPTPPFTGSHHWTSNQHRISGAAPTLIFIKKGLLQRLTKQCV